MDKKLKWFYFNRGMGQPGGAAASLAPPSTNLELWFRADADVYTDTGKTTPAGDDDSVGAWGDQSGNGLDATQATGANQPTYKTSIVGGRPVIRFDGTGDTLVIATGPGGGATDLTIIGVFVPVRAGGGYVMDVQTGRLVVAFDGAINDNLITFFDGTFKSFGSAHSESAQIVAWHLTADPTIYVDGVSQAATGTDSYTQQALGGAIGIGGRYDNTANRYQGDMAELLVYSAALDNDNLNQAGDYLADKYGLTWTTVT